MVLALIGWALAQDYAFPSSAEDHGHYYPTAYKDHAGVDWNCGTIRYGGHQGSDFGAGSFTGMDEGRDVSAAAEGTVIALNDGEFDRCTTGDCAGGSGFGNYVKIAHDDGRITLYGHLKQWSVLVGVGDRVVCGQKLGEMGSSGYSTGPHLHFEVRNSAEVAEDPFDGPCSAPPTYWVDQGAYADLPGLTCADPPECVVDRVLGCGDVVVGRNDEVGSTSAVWQYGCEEWVYTGPERAYEVVTGLDEPVTVTLEGLAADLDLKALASVACDGSDCLASSSNPDASDEVVVFEASADVPTVVVVDGWEGAVSDYVLTVQCVGDPPTEPEPVETASTADTAVPPSTGGPSTGPDTLPPTGSTGGATTAPPTGERPAGPTASVAPAPSGCGCASGGAPGVGGGLLAMGLLWRRRP